MKKIVVPTDFSPAAHNAFEYALQLAGKFRATLVLVHVIPPKPDIGRYPMPSWLELVDVDRTEEALEKFKAYEQEVQVRLGGNVDVEIELRSGNPVSEIVRMSNDADLLVMGTQGIESADSKVFGSVTGQVVLKSRCPVMAVPESAVYHEIKNIVFGTTLKEEEIGGLDTLLNFAETLGAKISFVHIEEKGENANVLNFSSIEQVYELHGQQQEVGIYQFTHTDIISGLQIFVNHTHAEVIAILSHHHDMWGKSMAKEMAYYSVTPVLVFHL
ncbi:MAG: universal stress protein [Bacteroidia bacterium]